MGLLRLRFGYYAQAGAATVVDDPTSAYNLKRHKKISEFKDWYFDNIDTLAPFMTVDTAELGHEFEFVPENSRFRHERLLELTQLEDCRFAIAVFDLHADLIRGDAFQHDDGRVALAKLIDKSKKFEIQIFNIGDKHKPLTKMMLENRKKEDKAHYLMANANRSWQLLERWTKY